MSRSKEAKELLRWAEQRDWEVARHTGSGHLFLVHRCGATVTMSGTPGDPRAVKNAKADMVRELRKYGL